VRDYRLEPVSYNDYYKVNPKDFL
jgi:hypothetical protein